MTRAVLRVRNRPQKEIIQAALLNTVSYSLARLSGLRHRCLVCLASVEASSGYRALNRSSAILAQDGNIGAALTIDPHSC